MKAPKCRVCETEHWGTEPHKLNGIAAPTVHVDPAIELRAEVIRLKARIVELEGTIAGLLARTANAPANSPANTTTVSTLVSTPPANRKEYQRNLMRQRRAAVKAG